MDKVSETEKAEIESVLDVRGLWCPEPAVRAKAALEGLAVGERLAVWSTDPLASVDLEVLCDRLGHRCIGHTTELDYTVTLIEKGQIEKGKSLRSLSG